MCWSEQNNLPVHVAWVPGSVLLLILVPFQIKNDIFEYGDLVSYQVESSLTRATVSLPSVGCITFVWLCGLGSLILRQNFTPDPVSRGF